MLDLAGLHRRALFFRLIREFFSHQGFLEVDTPLRQPVYIPESNIDVISADGQYLQSSPELSMKRLLAAGGERIFQLCHSFRKGEKGRLHLEEFQLLEWYRRDSDYRRLMTDCEQLLAFLAEGLAEAGHLPRRAPPFAGLDLAPPWPRLSVATAFAAFSPIPLSQALAEGRFDELLVEHVEPELGRKVPHFLCDYPVELASLARKKDDAPELAERFELYISGVELANGFSELTDAVEQRQRLAREIKAITARSGRSVAMPERFLAELPRLGRAAGIALGVDRLFMLAEGYRSIAEAVSFAPDDFS
jgi:elongation factor P--(R)-beta-lysine ligase